MFPQGEHVLTGKCAFQHAYHGYAQSMGGSTKHPSLPSFRGFPEDQDGAQAHLKAVGLQCLCGVGPCSKPRAYLPKTVFQKEIKKLGWEDRLKEPYSSE